MGELQYDVGVRIKECINQSTKWVQKITNCQEIVIEFGHDVMAETTVMTIFFYSAPYAIGNFVQIWL